VAKKSHGGLKKVTVPWKYAINKQRFGEQFDTLERFCDAIFLRELGRIFAHD
jgi:hypothetical protein